MDEFRIEAENASGKHSFWTRSKLGNAQSIADKAVRQMGYTKATVTNTYGGAHSEPLYVVTAISHSQNS
jgi:hypothetical protein